MVNADPKSFHSNDDTPADPATSATTIGPNPAASRHGGWAWNSPTSTATVSGLQSKHNAGLHVAFLSDQPRWTVGCDPFAVNQTDCGLISQTTVQLSRPCPSIQWTTHPNASYLFAATVERSLCFRFHGAASLHRRATLSTAHHLPSVHIGHLPLSNPHLKHWVWAVGPVVGPQSN